MSTTVPPLAVVGMHRSGTSLAANWLAHCGLNVGEHLLRSRVGNPAGHYEDMTFLALHEKILSDNGRSYLTYTGEPLTVSLENRELAQNLIDARQNIPQWGWKDPRTTLLLDFWYSLLPDLKVLAVFRHYSLVVDSLLRREQKVPKNRRAVPRAVRWTLRFRYSTFNLPYVRLYLRVWAHYNRAILAFAAHHPDNILLCHVDDLIAHSGAVLDYLNTSWHYVLAPVDITTVLVQGMLKENKPLQSCVWSQLEGDCPLIFEKLQHQSRQTLARLGVV